MIPAKPFGRSAGWRPSTPADIEAISAIEKDVHPLLQERPGVHAEKIRLFPEGCRVLAEGTATLGYAVAYPWRFGDIPQLDTLLDALPEPADCLFIHDVALLPTARGQGAAGAFVAHVAGLAARYRVSCLALVSVYGTVPVWQTYGFEIEPGLPPGKLAGYGATARYMRRDLI